MLSAVILHARREPALALTLSRLVEGALDGLLGDVVIVDFADDPLAARLSDEGGCARIGASDGAPLRRGVEAARGAWILVIESGVAPRPGWPAAAREALALAGAGAPGPGWMFTCDAAAGGGLAAALRARLRRRPPILLASRALAVAAGEDFAVLEQALRRSGARRVGGVAVDERVLR